MFDQPRRRTRLIAGMLAGAMALSLTPLIGTGVAGAADPLPPISDPIADGAFCDDAPGTNPFSDLGAETASTREVILCLVAAEITAGTGDGTTYEPGLDVTREQMAVFITRLANLLDENGSGFDFPALPTYDGTPDFSDVPPTSFAAAAIGSLNQAGIVGGFGDTFRPGDPVSRRQMAAFINRLQDFYADPFVGNGDYFDDDNGDQGEANLNALAEVGIFQGDGQGNVFPVQSISRRQMANVLMRTVQVYFGLDLIDTPFTGGGSNQALAVTPADLATLEFVAPDPDSDTADDRQYSVSGLTDAAYRITLVQASNITIDGGQVSFADADDDNIADPGNTNTFANITVVNGAALSPPSRTAPAATTVPGTQIAPVNGTITFTIDGYASGSLRPVVYVNDGASSFLEIDDDGLPIEDFGIGGVTTFIAEEAADGVPLAGAVTSVGPDNGYAEVNPGGTAFFRAGDVYRIDDGVFCQSATPAEFFQNLSVGDTIRTAENLNVFTVAPYDQDGPNTYCLTDDAPAGPTAVAAILDGTAPDTTVQLSWTAEAGVDSQNVYRLANPADMTMCEDEDIDDYTLVDNIGATEDSFEVTGLTAATEYCFLVTSVSAQDESEPDAVSTDGIETADVVEAPIVTSAAITDDVVPTDDATIGDEFTLVFDEEMDPATLVGALFSVTDGADTTVIRCTLVGAEAGITDAACTLGDGGSPATPNDTLVITLAENGQDGNGGGDSTVDLPLTITAISQFADLDDGVLVDIAGSTDLTIN